MSLVVNVAVVFTVFVTVVVMVKVKRLLKLIEVGVVECAAVDLNLSTFQPRLDRINFSQSCFSLAERIVLQAERLESVFILHFPPE